MKKNHRRTRKNIKMAGIRLTMLLCSLLLVFALPISGFAQEAQSAAADGDSALADQSSGTPDAVIAQDGTHSAADLEKIAALTTAPAAGSNYDGYIVKIKARSVDNELLADAPTDPVANQFFRVDTPEDALDFATPADIEYIQPNYVFTMLSFPTDGNPNDPLYQNNTQWNLNGEYGIHPAAAWAKGLNGSGETIAVLDTGVNSAHTDFTGTNILTGYNFTDSDGSSYDTDTSDNAGHGTMVTSIIAASTNNANNIAGIAYGASILPVKVMDKKPGDTQASGTLLQMVAGLNQISVYDTEHPGSIAVVNMSLGVTGSALGSDGIQALQEMIAILHDQGIILVAAVGNDGSSTLYYPAACDSVVGVGALNSDGTIANISERNSSVDVVAPGTNITGLLNTSDTGTTSGSGTSYAAPEVSALAALAKQDNPSLTPDGFDALLESTAVDMGVAGRDDTYGYGRVDMNNVFSAASPPAALPSGNPIGHVDSVSASTATLGQLSIKGWAFDGDAATQATQVHVYVGGPAGAAGTEFSVLQADQTRPDIGIAYPGVGDNHGFSGTVTTTKRGSVPVYIYAINIGAGSNVLIGTKTVTVGAPPGNPIGCVDSVSASTETLGQLSVRGWALDGDAVAQATQVHVYVGGPAGAAGAELFGLQANQPRPDVNAAYPGVGDNHGFSGTVTTTKRGSVPVYIYAINIGAGSNVLIGTKTVTVGAPPGNPIGHVDSVSASTATLGQLSIGGWALDGDAATQATQVHVYVGGPAGAAGAELFGLQANQPRPDVNAAYPGVGDNHGFSGTVTTTKRGSVPVYIYAINIGAGTNVLIGTKTVTVGAPPGNPIGHVDSVSASTATLGQLSIGGWALDGDAATQATQVHVYVGGPAGTAGAELFGLQANQTRSDVGAAYPGVGDNHGFSSTIVTAKRGSVPVYIYAINIGAGSNVLIGTKTVMVGAPLGNPIGHVDAYSNSNGNLNVSGWAVDGDSPATPITIHVYENGPAGTGTLLTAFTAGLSRPDVNIAYPGIGNNHGFSQTLNIHSASIVYIYAINIGSGTNVLIGTNAQPVLRGIDVSYWNGGGDNPSTPAINWAAVAQSGIRFAMLRAGWIGTDGVFNVDSTYAFNVRNARANGVLVGAYIYEYSSNYNTQSAGISAFASYTRSQGIILDLPVALDVEDSIYKAGTDANGGYSYMTNLIRSGMLQLRALGYKPAFYTSLNWAQTEFDATQLEKESNTFWLASWYNNNAELSPNTITWNGGYPGIWQYRSTGSVSGITGNVDMDYLYPNKLN